MESEYFTSILALLTTHMLCITSEHVAEEFFLPQNNFIEEVSFRKYSHFRNENFLFTQKSDILLQNLVEMVASLPSCLNHIINYNGIDVKPFKSPVVLSRYDVIHVKYNLKKRWIKANGSPLSTNWKRLFAYEKVSKILANETKEIPWCKRESIRDDLECFDIPFVENGINGRGWWCESHWYIFPPNPVQDPLFYERGGELLTGLRLLIPGSFKKFWSHKLAYANWRILVQTFISLLVEFYAE